MRVLFRMVAMVAALGLPLNFLQSRPAAAEDLESGVLAEVNFARSQPRQYARALQRLVQASRDGGPFLSYADFDPEALDEAIDFLMRQDPLPPLRPDARIADAARDHAAAQGGRGEIGHAGPGRESLGQRLQRRGVWAGLMAENISYGFANPREVVAQLIIDSGVAGRGHRKNIFGRSYQVAGVACGAHRTYASMCVIDFAGALVAR